jgi:hypothetical protein
MIAITGAKEEALVAQAISMVDNLLADALAD